MDFSTLPDWVKTSISSISGGVVGVLSAWAIEWYKKRKSPKTQEADLASQLTTSAKDSVETTKIIVDLLEERLVKERIYYDELIARSKKDCESQINDMKTVYDEIIEDLQAQIIKGETENNELRKQIYTLTGYKETLQLEVIDLNNRLMKYEKRDVISEVEETISE